MLKLFYRIAETNKSGCQTYKQWKLTGHASWVELLANKLTKVWSDNKNGIDEFIEVFGLPMKLGRLWFPFGVNEFSEKKELRQSVLAAIKIYTVLSS